MKNEKDVKKLEKMILDILQTVPETRDNDELLYINVCMKINPTIRVLRFDEVLLNTKALGIPQQETVERYRRKIQQYHSELHAKKHTENWRKQSEEEYKQYSKEYLSI